MFDNAGQMPKKHTQCRHGCYNVDTAGAGAGAGAGTAGIAGISGTVGTNGTVGGVSGGMILHIFIVRSVSELLC